MLDLARRIYNPFKIKPNPKGSNVYKHNAGAVNASPVMDHIFCDSLLREILNRTRRVRMFIA
jgi:hypothetical protein